jgi:hypothetical protein
MCPEAVKILKLQGKKFEEDKPPVKDGAMHMRMAPISATAISLQEQKCQKFHFLPEYG